MKILQLFWASLGQSPRPTRISSILQEFGHVTVCSAPPAPSFKMNIDNIELVEIVQKPKNNIGKLLKACTLLLQKYENDIWSPLLKETFATLQKRTFSLIVCQDIMLLPLAIAVKNLPQNKEHCRVIMDAREFYPRELEHSIVWNIFFKGLKEYLCKKYLPQADVVFTVSPGLAQGFKEEYGVTCEVLPSLSYYHHIEPKPTSKTIRCIHHGFAMPGRKLELMIEAFKPLEATASLDFMLAPSSQNPTYLKELQALAQNTPHVNFIPTVPMSEIVSFIAQYDMGVYLLPSNAFNHQHALPNKFFEFIQARLGVIVSPVQDMAMLTKEHGIGLVTEDFSPQSLTKAMQSLSPEKVDNFKAKAHEAAKKLCWEQNDEKLRQTIMNIHNHHPRTK